MGYGNPDVYYQPEDFGLVTVAQLDLTEPDYSFDMVVVWEHHEYGLVYWAHDSGCSCPSPFEEYTDLEQLTLVFSDTIDELKRYVAHSPDASERARFLRKVADACRRMEAG